MKNKKIPVFILGSLFAIAIVTITMISYIDYVQESLWDKSLDDIFRNNITRREVFEYLFTKGY